MNSLPTPARQAAMAALLFLWSASTSAQVIFRDDFNRSSLGANWIAPEYARWSIVDGKAYNFIDGQGGTLQTANRFLPTSYVIETAASDFRVNYFRQYGITFGKPDPNQDYGYILQYQPYYNQGLSLGRSEGNEFYPVVLANTNLTLTPGQSYRFKIERSVNGLIQVFIDGGGGYGTAPVLQAVDSTYPTLGHFGWRVDTETYAEPFYVDWIEARQLTTAAPSLITNVTVTNGKTYPVASLATGMTHYTDRSYTFTSLPPYLNGAAFIKTANDDKTNASPFFLTFELTKASHLYIFYDSRATVLPAWMEYWVKLPDQVGTTDPGTSTMHVYTRTYQPGTVTLGGNLAPPAAGSQMNYLVSAVPTPAPLVLEAEEATLTGAKVSSVHPGYTGTGFVDYVNASNDAVAWTVNVPATAYYQLAFKFALQSGVRPMEVKVNGTVVQSYLPFPATGGWNGWHLVSTGSVLRAGMNTVQLTAVGSSGPNVDYLEVNPGGNAVLPGMGNRIAHETNRPAASAPAELGNFPNPAQYATTIRYEVKEPSPVHLAVYDALGRQVAMLVNNYQQPGRYEQPFGVGGLSNGVYYYQLSEGKKKRTGRMVVHH